MTTHNVTYTNWKNERVTIPVSVIEHEDGTYYCSALDSLGCGKDSGTINGAIYALVYAHTPEQNRIEINEINIVDQYEYDFDELSFGTKNTDQKRPARAARLAH